MIDESWGRVLKVSVSLYAGWTYKLFLVLKAVGLISCFGVRPFISMVAHALACRPGLPPVVTSSHLLAQDTHEDHDTSTENADESNHDPQFEPIVSLPEQEIKTLEEDEEELFKM